MTISPKRSNLFYGTDPVAAAVRTSISTDTALRSRPVSEVVERAAAPMDLQALYPSLYPTPRAAHRNWSLPLRWVLQRSLFVALGCMVAASAIPLASPAQDAPVIAVGSCSTAAPNRDAAVTYASPPDVPAIAREMHANGTTVVHIDLTASGALGNASIARSSGNRFLDRAALNATSWSSFRPEMRNCWSLAGSYLYVVDFPE